MWLKLYGLLNPVASPYSFNHITPLIFQDAHAKLVKQTGAVSFGHCFDLYVVALSIYGGVGSMASQS